MNAQVEVDDPIKDFEQACENAAQVQRDLLAEILEKNTACEYLQRYGKPTSLEAFKAQVPVVSYEDVAVDIQRIFDGDMSPILCSEPITEFFLSSGTSSGIHKIIPQTKDSGAQMRMDQTSKAYRDKLFPLDTSKPVGLIFSYCMEQRKSNSGLVLRPMTTKLFKTQSLRTTSPYELTASASDWRQTTYCHLLCGLLQRYKVDYIYAVFAYTLSEALKMLRLEWKEMCEDISTGCLNKKITDDKLRLAVSELLKPSKELAEEVWNICSRESWDGIIPLLWPRSKCVQTIVTGAMEPYVPTLKKRAGELPIVGLNYSSSEGSFGINVQPTSPPEKVEFTIVPYSVFFEFIPVEASEQDEKESIVGVGEVQPGKLYELVVTTRHGLYRYKVGDVVKVTGFYYKAPQLAFSHRKNAALSVITDKVDEQELQNVILNTARLHGLEVANFTTFTDFISEEPPHYVIFWELASSDDINRHEALTACCETIDKAFNLGYIVGRVEKMIGPLELVKVKHGTFEKLMGLAVRNGASPAQYKTPRCVTSPAMMELLKDGIICSYRSVKEVPVSLLHDWKPTFKFPQVC